MSEIPAIEQALERDRMALAQSLAALRDRLSPSNLVSEGKDALLAQAEPLMSRVDGMLRGRPVVAAVAGVALAALIFGRSRADRPQETTPALAGSRFEALARWEDEGGPPASEPVDPEEDWLIEARGVHEKARRMLSHIDEAARRGLAPAAELARHRAEVVSALAADLRVALGRGLGALTDAAREQALQARERIYLSRITMADKGREHIEANPLAAAALMAGAGAALACVFPQTRTEDQLFGEASDRLAEDARKAVLGEVVKTSDLAKSIGSALHSDPRRAAAVFTTDTQARATDLRH